VKQQETVTLVTPTMANVKDDLCALFVKDICLDTHSPHTWGNMTVEEKKKMLQQVAEAEQDALVHPSSPNKTDMAAT
jgi:hypothetical protein